MIDPMNGPFVYHWVTRDIRGSILYPLNQLKEAFPDVYSQQVKKYKGREHVLEIKIPEPLNCLWNDVLHFTAVTPSTLYQNLKNVGCNAQNIVWRRWFKVPITLFDSSNTMVCSYTGDVRDNPDAREFHPFDPQKMDEYRTVPNETIEYYKEQFVMGKRPLYFHRVPHILYKGTIDTINFEIFEL